MSTFGGLVWMQDRVNELLNTLERIATALEKLAEAVGDGVLFVKDAGRP